MTGDGAGAPAGLLPRRELRGLELTEIGLGGASLGNLYSAIPDHQAAETVQAAWQAGIRHVDTAPHYGLGLSERRLGAALRGLPREEVVVSTKVGRLLVPDPQGSARRDDQGFEVPATHRRKWDFSRDGILRSVEESLTRLDLDRVDIAYLHDPEDHWQQAVTEGLPTLLELRDQGVVRAVGAGMNYAQPLEELVRHHDVDVVLCAGRHTLLEQAFDLLDLALERSVGVVVAGVYHSGLLATPRPTSDAKYDYGPAPDHVVARTTAIAAVCERHGVTLPEAAIAFPLRHPAVVSVVVGAATPAELRQSVARYCATVPDELWTDLTEQGLLESRRDEERQ